MTVPTVFETCQPREDVLSGTIAEADLADLAKVIRGTASDDYKIPARFFANTYPTAGLKNLLRNVLARKRGPWRSAGPRLFRVRGAKKSKALLRLDERGQGSACLRTRPVLSSLHLRPRPRVSPFSAALRK
jgi:hypothetical protein